MTTPELAESQSDVAQVFAAVSDVLLKRGRVEIDGFGVFELRRRKPRRARNPRTGARIDVLATTTIRFTPAKSLKTNAASISDVPLDA